MIVPHLCRVERTNIRKNEVKLLYSSHTIYPQILFIRLLSKLGDDGFSLVLFGTKVADSKEFCKKSIINQINYSEYHYGRKTDDPSGTL